MKVLTLSEIKHNGIRHKTDTVFELDDDAGENLINLGVVKEATKEDELVAKARREAKAEEAKKPKVKTSKKESKEKEKEEFSATEGFSFGNHTWKKRTSDKGNIRYVCDGRLVKKEDFDEAFKGYSKESGE